MSLLADLVSSLLEMPNALGDAAGVDPLSAVLLGIGGLVMLGSLGYFGVLVAGAAVSLLRPEGGGRDYPPAR